MADKAIPTLTAAAALTGAELLHCVQGGNSRKVTAQDIADLGAISALDDVGDVDASAPSAGDLLMFDGSDWVNAPGFRAAMVKKAADQTAADYTTAANIAWDSEVYDTDGIHDNASNNSRLTVPAGVSYVKVGGTVATGSVVLGSEFNMLLLKNGSSSFDGSVRQVFEGPTTTLSPGGSFASGAIPVSPGDYFEINFQVIGDSSITITASRSNFWMEIVQ
jgi:hypothetical protein